MKALIPGPGAGETVPEMVSVTAPLGVLGLADTVTVAAAATETIGNSARNATSIPAAMVGSVFK